MAKGYDYAFAPHPSVSALKADGATFVARYLSHSSNKNLTSAELHALNDSGIAVVVVFEDGAFNTLSGHGQGLADATYADEMVRSMGMSGIPIFFAADFDATEGQQAAIDSYLDGVASVIGRNRTGLYAGYYPTKRAFDAGKIAWGWQAYAWSAGQWDARAQLRQTLNGVSVGGAPCDLDQSMQLDFGQWPRYVKPKPPAPTPPPVTPGNTKVPDCRGMTAGHAHNALVAAHLAPVAPIGQQASWICTGTRPVPGMVEATGTHVTISAGLAPELQKGDTGSWVTLLQRDLNKGPAGHAELTLDGVFGDMTKSELIAFQSQHGLAQDGIAGPKSWAKLGAM